MDTGYHRCHKLHATITLAHCEAMRKRPQHGTLMARARPPQCNGCEDWRGWTDEQGANMEGISMGFEKGTCAGCGETKTLLTKTLCHKCHAAETKRGTRATAAASPGCLENDLRLEQLIAELRCRLPGCVITISVGGSNG
jgi:hypothetical protein